MHRDLNASEMTVILGVVFLICALIGFAIWQVSARRHQQRASNAEHGDTRIPG